jgi:transposase
MQQPKQEIKQSLTINGREAVTVTRAIEILLEVTGHMYTRDSVYRMLQRGEIEAERTEAANFYYVDSLRAYQRKSKAGRHQGKVTHPPAMRQKAQEMKKANMSNAAIGQQLGVSRQTILRWISAKPETDTGNA